MFNNTGNRLISKEHSSVPAIEKAMESGWNIDYDGIFRFVIDHRSVAGKIKTKLNHLKI